MNERISAFFSGMNENLAFVLKLIYIFCPLLILKLDILISIFLLIIMMVVPLWGEVLRFILYVWACSVALSSPIDIFSVLFFICAALYFTDSILRMFVKK